MEREGRGKSDAEVAKVERTERREKKREETSKS